MLREAAFDPTHESTTRAIERIDKFHEIVEERTCKYFLTLVLNDGGAAHRDLSPRTRSVTYDFIRRAFELHSSINEWEAKQGFPGMRTVIAGGFRMRRRQVTKSRILSGIASRLISRAQSGEIPLLEAVYKAATLKPFFAAIPELQANFAFSKAYIAESSGSKGGLPGANIFLDGSLIQFESPDGLVLRPAIDWEYPGLESTFYPIEGIDRPAAGRSGFAGFCNAFETAENLASVEGVVKRLRGQRITSAREI